MPTGKDGDDVGKASNPRQGDGKACLLGEGVCLGDEQAKAPGGRNSFIDQKRGREIGRKRLGGAIGTAVEVPRLEERTEPAFQPMSRNGTPRDPGRGLLWVGRFSDGSRIMACSREFERLFGRIVFGICF